MNKEELIVWFNNIFNNCYYATHDDYPDHFFMYYDLRFVRKLKLSNIEKKECLPPKTISGERMFDQDWVNNKFWCNYSKIWKYLQDNYSSKFSDIQSFIKDRLEEQDKKKVLTPTKPTTTIFLPLEEQYKMKVLTPISSTPTILFKLDKMKILIPDSSQYKLPIMVEEHNKMKVTYKK